MKKLLIFALMLSSISCFARAYEPCPDDGTDLHAGDYIDVGEGFDGPM